MQGHIRVRQNQESDEMGRKAARGGSVILPGCRIKFTLNKEVESVNFFFSLGGFYRLTDICITSSAERIQHIVGESGEANV